MHRYINQMFSIFLYLELIVTRASIRVLYFLSANGVIRPNGFTTPLQLVRLHVGRLEGDVKVTQPKTD